MHVLSIPVLPWQLDDVVVRLFAGCEVYGFELELLADYASRL